MSQSLAWSKKQIERHYLDKFQALWPAFPAGRIEETEEPDFLVHTDKAIIGIELTELHQQAPQGTQAQQAGEAMRHRAVATAQERFIATGLPSARVSVFFNQGVAITKADVDRLSRAICDIAVRNLPDLGGSRTESYEWTNRAYFPEELHSITVRRIPEITQTHFTAPGATWVVTLRLPDVARAISAKEPKCPAYRSRCDNLWLVVNTDLRPMSTWYQFDAQSLDGTLKSGFDRVFIFRHFPNAVVELALEQ